MLPSLLTVNYCGDSRNYERSSLSFFAPHDTPTSTTNCNAPRPVRRHGYHMQYFRPVVYLVRVSIRLRPGLIKFVSNASAHLFSGFTNHDLKIQLYWIQRIPLPLRELGVDGRLTEGRREVGTLTVLYYKKDTTTTVLVLGEYDESC